MSETDLWTIGVAAYAAVVSTFVLGWDAYKWLASGARIDITVSLGMKIIGGYKPDDETYVCVKAYNVGDRPTTIVNLGGLYYESWWRAYISKRNAKLSFIVTQPSEVQRIPYRFEIGDQWMGLMDQSDDIVKMAEEGYLFIVIYTSQSSHGIRARVKTTRAKP